MLSDTSPEAEKVRIRLLQEASLQERFALTCSLTATAVSLSRRAIARANPHLTPEEVGIKFVELHYGEQLAAGLREYLKNRS